MTEPAREVNGYTVGEKARLLPGSLAITSPVQSDLAREYFEERGVNAEESSQQIKQKFIAAIVGVYRGKIVNALKKVGGDPVTITEKLEMHRATQWRWAKERVGPTFETYCLAMAAFDVDLGPDLPRGREAVLNAMGVTLSFVRREITGKSEAKPSRSDIVYLHFTSLSKHWWIAQATERPHHLNNALEAIGRSIMQAGERVPLPSAEGVRNVLREWNTEWCLFHFLSPYSWLFELRE